ncbi:MAG: nucleoside hydrolase [Marinomonas sp.]
MTRKIIIDTDPGIDDAMAIFFAFQAPQLDVLGLTTTFGNVPVELATKNAITLTEIAKVTVPVAQGVSVPFIIAPRPHPDFVHGVDGFGNINWPDPKGKAVDKSAAQFIVDTVRQYPGEVTIIALGPLGNLASALILDPEVADLVDEVILMGGTALEYGNVSPVAEANIINDPHAADAVFTASWQVTMIGLDVTHQVLLDNSILGRIKQTNLEQGAFLYDCAQHYINFYSSRFNMDGCYFHDASTIAYAIDPSLFGVELGAVRVACEGIGIGQTIFAPQGMDFPEPYWNDVPMTQVCMEVDSERLLALFETTLS